jgi:hypothetical protein
MRKAKKVKLLGTIVGCCLIFCIALSLFCIKRRDNNIQERGVEMRERELTKKQIIQIASKAFEERYGWDVNKCKIKYDKGNKDFNKYYAKLYPHLAGHDYQAVRFITPGPLTPGGGPHWVCIDRKSGEVLLNSVGL